MLSTEFYVMCYSFFFITGCLGSSGSKQTKAFVQNTTDKTTSEHAISYMTTLDSPVSVRVKVEHTVLHTLSCGSVMEMASTFTLVLSVSLLPYLS